MLISIYLIFLIKLSTRTRADVYTAVADFEYLLEAHRTVKDYLNYYIERHETRLAILKSYLENFKREHVKAMKDITSYLDNPINVFTLIKRLTLDVYFIKHSIKDETDFIANITNNNYKSKYPTMADLRGAAEAITRLQDVYKLQVRDFSEGKLSGSIYSTPMTACDCFELGRALYQETDFVHGVKWILEAFRKYNEESMVYYPFSAFDLIEHISYGYSKLGDLKTSLHWIQKILAEDPNNSRAIQIAQFCRSSMEDETYRIKTTLVNEEEKKRRQVKAAREVEVFPLCRGDMEVPIEISSRLTCRYLTETHPFLKLAPFKIEMLYINPDVVLFHDVLTDNEMEALKEMAKSRFKRSGVHDPKSYNAILTRQRISKTAWLYDEDIGIIARISLRVIHMTGLSLESAEELQVVNYGIGGFYDLHYDFLQTVSQKIEKSGNRIATVLFYMSDVAQGGATVFPALGLSVLPKKGTSIFWYNLHSSGEGNLAMQHAACPVLQGSKWVSTKWIHEFGQEFIKPCNLENSENHNYPHPVLKTSKKELNNL